MQSFGDLFANNRLLAIGIVLAGIAVILAVGIALFKLVFGRRLHMSGGRTRQPRLGVVDAFDLDRQRQLVLIRRDNIEHLLMIGGPNDVLIEAAIVRMPSALGSRDKENGFGPTVGIPAPVPPATLSHPATPLPSVADVEGGAPNLITVPPPPDRKPDATPEQVRATSPADSAPMPASPAPQVSPAVDSRLPPAGTLPAGSRPLPSSPRPVSTLPPRPPVTPMARPAAAPVPRPNFSRATPVVTPPATQAPEVRQPGRTEPSMGRPQPEVQMAGARTVPEPLRDGGVASRPPGGRLPPRTDEASKPLDGAATSSGATDIQDGGAVARQPQPRQTPIAGQPAPASRAPQPRPAPPTPSQTRAAPPSLSSLEEEMAKLLGRPMPPSDTPG